MNFFVNVVPQIFEICEILEGYIYYFYVMTSLAS
jgi:hypothetical protein